MEHQHEIAANIADLGIAYNEYQQLILIQKKRFRRWWSKPLIRNNYLTGYGNYTTVFKYFKLNDEEEFIQFTRMTVEAFEYLYSLVKDSLIKRSRRPSLPPELRLSLTLNYLAHGDTASKNKWFQFVGLSTIYNVIKEVCTVLYGLAQGHMNLPPATPLPNTNILSPYLLIGDGGFGLHPYLMKPFVQNNNLPVLQKVYNFRLCHARRIIESAFGELSQRWLVNETSMAWKLPTTEKIIISTVCLHNYLIDMEQGEVNNRWNAENDVNELVQENGIAVHHQRNDLPQFRIRQELARYFVSDEGAVPWQWDKL